MSVVTEIVVRLTDESISELELDRVMHDLRDEVLELDVESVELPAEVESDGTRGAELVEQGVLIVKAAVDAGLPQAIAQRVSGWFGRQDAGRLEITVGSDKLIVKKATPEQQDKLIEHFLRSASGDHRG